MRIPRLTDFRFPLAVISAAVLLAFSAPAFAVPASATASLPPHVASSTDTDACAMCHRTHTSPSTATWNSAVMPGLSGSALLAVEAANGDVGMCYVCHGVDALGSGSDVQSSFDASSAHSLNPSSSEYGPSPKQCSTCHDSHGSARIATGTPYPALLRDVTSTGTPQYAGNAFCGACHTVRANSSFMGLAVFAQTAHARIATPTTGTGIICNACHDPHGSSIAPMIRSTLATPSAPSTATVTANDRSLCFGCHAASLGTWTGSASYAAAHASSSATVAITGEWPAPGASRRVGECQSCHNPTGSLDASGVLVPRLLAETQPALCYGCHRTGGSAAANLASGAYTATTSDVELLATFAGQTSPAAYGRLQVYSRESTAVVLPVGPQELSGLGTPGALASGDIDGDGVADAIVADSASAHVAVVRSSALRGVSRQVYAVPNAPAFVAVGDVFLDGSLLPELVTVSAAGDVDVLRYSGGTFVTVASTTISGNPSGLALGDVTGSGGADIVVTTQAPDDLWIITENGAALSAGSSPFATGSLPVAVATGDVRPGGTKLEIAVANAGEAVSVVQVFNGEGASLFATGGPLPAGVATAIAVGNVLPGVSPASTSGLEIALAYAAPDGSSGVLSFPQLSGGGLGTPDDAALGTRRNPTSLSAGDVDGDGTVDLAVALAGRYLGTAASVAPAVTMLTPNGAGTALVVPASPTFPAGGVELSGATPRVLVANIGAVGPSRHAEQGASHVSTETAVSTLHVICSDCHNSHLAAAAASSTVVLPGALFGARGVIPTNGPGTVTLSAPTTATAEYQVCFRCHAGQDAEAAYSLATVVSTAGASMHPIESALSTPTNATGVTMVAGVGTRVRCSSCHGTPLAAPVAKGPHVSSEAPLLAKPYLGTSVADGSLLCYSCHIKSVYLDGFDGGANPGRSGFYDTSGANNALHAYHADRGMGCESCHVSHGSTTLPHLLRSDGFTWSGPDVTYDGSCASACHVAGATHGYKR